MQPDFVIYTATEMDDGVLLRLPDGASVQVPQATMRRSVMLQQGIHACDTAGNSSISLPHGVLQDWLQSVDTLKASATSPGNGTDIARNPHLLRFVRVRFFSMYGLEWCFTGENKQWMAAFPACAVSGGKSSATAAWYLSVCFIPL